MNLRSFMDPSEAVDDVGPTAQQPLELELTEINLEEEGSNHTAVTSSKSILASHFTRSDETSDTEPKISKSQRLKRYLASCCLFKKCCPGQTSKEESTPSHKATVSI